MICPVCHRNMVLQGGAYIRWICLNRHEIKAA